MLRNGNKRGRGGKRAGAGRKLGLATILKRQFIQDREGEAEKAFAYLCAVRDNEKAPEQWRVIASDKIMDRVWGKAKERIELNWREKAKELGYDPESIIQQFATSIAEMGNRGSGDRSDTASETDATDAVSE